MDRDRLLLQLTQYRKAMAALADAIATDDGDKKSRDSILLSFVFTFEMAWKSLKTALALRGLKAPDFAAAVLKAGVQAGVIEDIQMWDLLKDHRNDVSHAYDQDKAIAIAAFVREEAMQQFASLLKRIEADE